MDIEIGLLDLAACTKSKEARYDYYTIGPENVSDVLETNFDRFDPGDWYRPEKETVRDLMLAGF